MEVNSVLSKKFAKIIRLLINMKQDLENKPLQPPNLYFQCSISDIFLLLSQIGDHLELPTNLIGSDNISTHEITGFNNHVHNYILNVNVINTCPINFEELHLIELKYLDTVCDNSKLVINECLDAVKGKYIMSQEICDQLNNKSHPKHKLAKLIAHIHFKVLFCKIFYKWNDVNNLTNNHEDIKSFNNFMKVYKCRQYYNGEHYFTLSYCILQLFDKVNVEYNLLFKLLEDLYYKYTL